MKRADFFDLLAARGMRVTDSQQRVIAHESGRAAVYAGPGSGKTTVLTLRAAYLHMVRGVPPQRIAVFTFTRKSAAELRQRLAYFDPALRRVTAGTFHSLFLRWLLKHDGQNPRLWTAAEQLEAMRTVLRSVHMNVGDESCEKYLQHVTQLKNGLQSPGRVTAKTSQSALVTTVYERYEDSKRRQRRWDYDDILLAFYHAVAVEGDLTERVRRSLDYVMIDEFQDTSKAQWLSITSLCKQHIPLLVVGDDDQSIYRFRGALPNMLRLFGQTYKSADEILLNVNFRSVDTVVRMSSTLIRHNADRRHKVLVGAVGDGVRPRIIRTRSEWAEADYVARTSALILRDRGNVTIGVLARSNRQLLFVPDALRRHRVSPGSAANEESAFFNQPPVRDALQLLRAAAGDESARRDAETVYLRWRGAPAEGLAKDWRESERDSDNAALRAECAQWLAQVRTLSPRVAAEGVAALCWTHVQHSAMRQSAAQRTADQLRSLLERAPLTGSLADWLSQIAIAKNRWAAGTATANVQILTFHGAKGLEFDCVFLIGLHDLAVPHPRAFEEAPRGLLAELQAEERRLLYVGLTRARRWLYLLYPRLAGKKQVGPSPFLSELGVPVPHVTARGERAAQPRKRAAPNAGAGRAMSAPAAGDAVRHKIFGSGTVETVEIMQDRAHKIAIIFSTGDKRFFLWETAVQLGHFEEFRATKGERADDRYDL
ncbi:MAG: ATP-dependent helicase [Bacilli bacterium]